MFNFVIDYRKYLLFLSGSYQCWSSRLGQT